MTEPPQLRPFPEGRKDAEEFLQEQHGSFLEAIKAQPAFRIACVTVGGDHRTLPELIDTNDATIIELLKNPPDQRPSGWNLDGPNDLTPTLHGIEKKEDWRHFEIWRTGYFVFSTPMDDMFCWKHADYGEPKPVLLNPVVLFEYTHSWLSLCVKLLGQQSGTLNMGMQLVVDMRLYNCNGFKLRPGLPGSIFYNSHAEEKIWTQPHIFLPKYPLQLRGKPGGLVKALMLRLYNAFGLGAEDMPKLLDEEGNFRVPERKPNR